MLHMSNQRCRLFLTVVSNTSHHTASVLKFHYDRRYSPTLGALQETAKVAYLPAFVVHDGATLARNLIDAFSAAV